MPLARLRASGWTLERRAKQSEAIRQWRPWEQSTGPRSDDGKAIASRNADKGSCREAVRDVSRALRAMMADQEDVLDAVREAIRSDLTSQD